MKLAAMNTREQVLVLITAAVVLGGGYGLLRYRPALKALAGLQAQTSATELRLKTLVIPEAPSEDATNLAQRMAEADTKLAAAKGRISEFEQNLPPPDTQEISLKISELASVSGLLVRENIAYRSISEATKATASIATPKGAGRADRRAAHAVRSAARASALAVAGRGGFAAIGASNLSVLPQPEPGTPGIGLEMLERYAQLDYARPMQRVSVNGNYADIRYFIDELQKLPWQVTVAQLQIETDARPSEPGMPQPLRATLILAL